MKKGILMVCLSLLLGSVVSAQTYKYIGADKCKMCHNKPATGNQYSIWEKGPHAKALATLSSKESLDYAKAHGIADPAKDDKCLKCHSTYARVDAKLRAGIKPTEGVSCETCHGPGSSYKSPSVMKNREQAMKMGLVMPDKQLCLECHNKENPFFKEFNFETYAAKIAHPNPQAKK
ncbi:MAG TPA: cytochrome c family protein [Bacteroidales bacterium]|nr:cytochrome c family protein [Bacteroidales bacterium]